jgi:hypothetical protein
MQLELINQALADLQTHKHLYEKPRQAGWLYPV